MLSNEPQNLSNVSYNDIDERIMHCNANNFDKINSGMCQHAPEIQSYMILISKY